jgi:hypothetical protein
VGYSYVRAAAPMLDPKQADPRVPTYSDRVAAAAAHDPQHTTSKVQVRTTENYWRNIGSVNAPGVMGHGAFSPTPPAEVNYVGLKLVPRLFKSATAGWASPASPGWPPSGSAGEFTTLRTPHIRPKTIARASSRAVGTSAAFNGGVNRGRIAPILVPRPRVAR